MTVKVSIKNVFGQDLIYPQDETTRLFTRLTGRKTLLASDIAIIKKLGYSVSTEAVTL